MPYTSKATGIPLVWLGAKLMMGRTLRELGLRKVSSPLYVTVKSPVFSFIRLKGADPILGVEMTSTGEVACSDTSMSGALIKTMLASNLKGPDLAKRVLVTVRDEDKDAAVEIVSRLVRMGHGIAATRGTADTLLKAGIRNVEVLKKIDEEGEEEDILTYIREQKAGFVINTPKTSSRRSVSDEYKIRRTAVEFLIPVITRIETAKALIYALEDRGRRTIPRPIALNDILMDSPYGKYV